MYSLNVYMLPATTWNDTPGTRPHYRPEHERLIHPVRLCQGCDVREFSAIRLRTDKGRECRRVGGQRSGSVLPCFGGLTRRLIIVGASGRFVCSAVYIMDTYRGPFRSTKKYLCRPDYRPQGTIRASETRNGKIDEHYHVRTYIRSRHSTNDKRHSRDDKRTPTTWIFIYPLPQKILSESSAIAQKALERQARNNTKYYVTARSVSFCIFIVRREARRGTLTLEISEIWKAQ